MKSTTPSSVTFCCVLSNSTQNGSASGKGKSVPRPTCCKVHVNGFCPSYSCGCAAAAEVAHRSTASAPTIARRMGRSIGSGASLRCSHGGGRLAAGAARAWARGARGPGIAGGAAREPGRGADADRRPRARRVRGHDHPRAPRDGHRPRRPDPGGRDRGRRPRPRRRRGRSHPALPRSARGLRRPGAGIHRGPERARSRAGRPVRVAAVRPARAGRAGRHGLRQRRSRAVGGGGRRAVHRVLRRGARARGHLGRRVGVSRDGAPRSGTEGLPGVQLPPPPGGRAHPPREPALMAERVDVCIVGSGFGGSISAYRLSELYRAAGVDPAGIVVLERGRRYQHTDFRQSMDIGNLAGIYTLVQSSGGAGSLVAPGPGGVQVVAANAVGGGSNLYLAASLRAPRETFERRDRRADDGPERRMWPREISRRSLDPYYARAERALRVKRPAWSQVSKSGGLWAATLDAAGHTCDRVPLAIDEHRCVNAKWCHTGCIFGAKNTVNTNYLASGGAAGVRVRPNRQAETIRRSTTAGYRFVVTASVMDNEGDNPSRQPTGASDEIECKVLILAAGAMGTPPLLMRSRPALPSLSGQVGRNLGTNGDHIAGVEYDERKVRGILGLPGYGSFHKGKPITTMTYDFWVGRRGHRHDGTRFTLQEIFLSSLTNFLYDDVRAPDGEPSWWGLQKKRNIATWSNHIELLAQVEDTHDGVFQAPPPSGSAIRPNAGPVMIAPLSYQLSEESIRVRELADKAMRQIVERRGLARFMALRETRGVYCAHPLGGCRMAESPDLGVVDHRCEAFGNGALFCTASSATPTSRGVNPSLTISAVSERAAAALVQRGTDYGLPAAPSGFRPHAPAVHVG